MPPFNYIASKHKPNASYVCYKTQQNALCWRNIVPKKRGEERVVFLLVQLQRTMGHDAMWEDVEKDGFMRALT